MSPREAADLLIIGGGPAGFSAAQAFRAHGGRGRMVILADDRDGTYHRPPLSKDFLRGETSEAQLRMPRDGEFAELRLERLVGSAQSLDLQNRIVTTSLGGELFFGACIIATGARPAALDVAGGDDPGLLTLRTLADAKALRQAARHGRSVVVVGSGFIGCEAAASLARLGLGVTQVSDEPGPQHRRLGSQVADRITGWLDAAGVRLVPGATVSAFERRGGCWVVHLGGSGDAPGEVPPEVVADFVLVAVGVTPSGGIAARAGLGMEGGAIVTDERMRTSSEGVYAAGDVARAHNVAAGRTLSVEHWGEAVRMGGIAGATAAGGADDEWANAPGFWSQIGDRTLKYAAWGDGYEQVRFEDHGQGSFTAWYLDENGSAVGVLTHQADEDFEYGQTVVEAGKAPPAFRR